MRLVESSDPGAVSRFEALDLIHERLVLARAVCAELEACGGNYAESMPAAALGLLDRWVGERYAKHAETHPSDGLAQMVVPAGAEKLMHELGEATEVCERLAMLWTADTRSEVESDSRKIAEALQGWRAGRGPS